MGAAPAGTHKGSAPALLQWVRCGRTSPRAPCRAPPPRAHPEPSRVAVRPGPASEAARAPRGLIGRAVAPPVGLTDAASRRALVRRRIHRTRARGATVACTGFPTGTLGQRQPEPQGQLKTPGALSCSRKGKNQPGPLPAWRQYAQSFSLTHTHMRPHPYPNNMHLSTTNDRKHRLLITVDRSDLRDCDRGVDMRTHRTPRAETHADTHAGCAEQASNGTSAAAEHARRMSSPAPAVVEPRGENATPRSTTTPRKRYGQAYSMVPNRQHASDDHRLPLSNALSHETLGNPHLGMRNHVGCRTELLSYTYTNTQHHTDTQHSQQYTTRSTITSTPTIITIRAITIITTAVTTTTPTHLNAQ